MPDCRKAWIYLLLVLSVAGAASSLPAAAHDTRSKRSMGYWMHEARKCGYHFESYVDIELGHLMGEMKGDFLQAAQVDGANEEQIEALGSAFDEGREEYQEKFGDQNRPEGFDHPVYGELMSNSAESILWACTRIR